LQTWVQVINIDDLDDGAAIEHLVHLFCVPLSRRRGMGGEPEKASQNALPSLLKRVWLAMAAAAACSSEGSFGEAGGVG
jgi:hypothetical protein